LLGCLGIPLFWLIYDGGLRCQESLTAPHGHHARAAQGYTEVELKRGHLSVRSLEVYIAENRESAKRKVARLRAPRQQRTVDTRDRIPPAAVPPSSASSAPPES
jgi:hypothetical protein